MHAVIAMHGVVDKKEVTQICRHSVSSQHMRTSWCASQYMVCAS